VQPRIFEYRRPTTVAEAVADLSELGDGARVLAGGQSLVHLMKLRLASPVGLVDLNGIPTLAYVKEEDHELKIGAMTRHHDLAQEKVVRDRYPHLAEAAEALGDPQVRNRGTIGGALAHADPASDWGTTLLAAGATVGVAGPKGEREIPMDSFFRESFTTTLSPSEILTEIRLPKARPGMGGAYRKLKRKTGDFATVGAAALLHLDAEGPIREARVALAAVGPTPVRASSAEAFLAGKSADPTTLREAAHRAAESAQPQADLRGSVEYKRAMTDVFVQRALEAAADRARGR
jgi:aerobic carbon-monoxide dehydrogenase medium subunit